MNETRPTAALARGNAIEKAIAILNFVRTSENGGSARELEALTSVPRSTVQRILITLADSGMVWQDPADERYRIGSHALWIGLGYQQSSGLVNLARPLMEKLRDITDETVGLSIAVGDARVFIGEMQSRSKLRFASELGRLFPLWAGASGRVLLSSLSDADIDRILLDDSHSDEVDNPRPAEENRKAIAQTREDGFATAFSESIAFCNSIAVPVLDANGRVLAALSISGPEGRLTREQMKGTLRLLLDSSHQLTQLLGESWNQSSGP